MINQKINNLILKNFKKINKIIQIKFKNNNCEMTKIKMITIINNIPTIPLWTIIVHIVLVELI